jgi:metal-sulfur cluster biosynthetic enzyme
MMRLKETIIDLLKQCYDPEIPVDLWSLGLIYDINIKKSDNNMCDVDIVMSLTTPGCSMGQHMADDIKSKVSSLDKIDNVNVSVTFDPPWQPEMMSEEAKNKLGFDNSIAKQNEIKIETKWE